MSEAFKFNNTRGVLNKIGEAINKVIRIYEVFIQLIFISYYSYNVWKNENLILFIINIALLSLSCIYFILYLITFFKSGVYDTVIRKKVHRYLTDFKILVRLFTIGLSIYSIVVYESTTIDKIFLVVSVVGLLLQLLLKIFQRAYDKYSQMLVVAFRMDVDEIKESPIGKTMMAVNDVTTAPKQTFLKVLNNGLKKVDNLIHGPEVTVITPEPEDKDKTIKSRITELSLAQKEKNEAREKQRREDRAKRLQEEKEKNHQLLESIFPKKKKKTTPDNQEPIEVEEIKPPKDEQ